MKSSIVLVVTAVFIFACGEKKNSASHSSRTEGSAIINSNDPAERGIVVGSLELSTGAPPSSISNANISVAAHPAIVAKTSDDGTFKIPNAPAGSLEIYVMSAAAAGLISVPSEYGIKLADVKVRVAETTDVGSHEMKKTGGLTGAILFYENPNNLDVTGSEVFIPGTSFIAKTDKDGKFTLAGLPEGTYTVRLQHTGFAISELSEVQVSSGEVTDIGIKYLSLSRGPEGKITVEGGVETTIAGNPKIIVKSRSVSAHLTFDSDAALMKVSDEPSFLNKSWKPVAATFPWEFSSDGNKSLYVMYSDLNGLESSPYSIDFIVDTEIPTVTSFSIMNGYDEISSSATSMNLYVAGSDTGSGVAKVMFCNSANFSGCSWQEYETIKGGWPLSATVYVKVKDYADRESVASSDTIAIGTHTVLPTGNYINDVVLHKAQSPFRMVGAMIFTKNLTIEPGVEIQMYGGDLKTLKVEGRLSAQGTSTAAGDRITLSKHGSATGLSTIDLSSSLSETNNISFLYMSNAKASTSTFLKINGGTVANSELNLGNEPFIEKTGFKPLTVSGNTLSMVKAFGVKVVTGSSTVIRDNSFSGEVWSNQGMIWQAGGTNTEISYNTVMISMSASCSSQTISGILVEDGDVTVSDNDIQVSCSEMMGYAYGLKISGGGTALVHHNNFSVSNSNTENNAVPIYNVGSASTLTVTNNYFTGHSTTNPNSPNGYTNNNPRTSGPWSISPSADCVGSACF